MASFWRATLIRTTIVLIVAAVCCAGWLALNWIHPDQVRAAVIAHFEKQFGGRVAVEVESAQLRLFGGLTIRNLRLTQHGEAEPFLDAPYVLIYHDKQKLSSGSLEIRKIELEYPTVRLSVDAKGTCDLSGIAPPPDAERSLPTILVRDATILLRLAGNDAIPELAIAKLQLSAINDPLPIVKFEVAGELLTANALQNEQAGAKDALRLSFQSHGRYHRTANHLSIHLETGELELNGDLAPALAAIHPTAAEYCEKLSAKLKLKADMSSPTVPGGMPKYDVRLEVERGRYEDAKLPWPLEHLAGTIRLNDGRVTIEKMTGTLGNAKAELTLDSKPDLLCNAAHSATCTRIPGVRPAGPREWPILLATKFLAPVGHDDPVWDARTDDPLRRMEDRLERFELKVLSLSLDDDLFGRLAPGVQKLRAMLNPSGPVDVAVRFKRTDGVTWRREVDIAPKALKIKYEYFTYPISDVFGSLKKVNASDGLDEFQADLNAKIAGKRLTLTGRVSGDGPDPLVDLTIGGKDIPIDADFFTALPPSFAQSVKNLHANARGNFLVKIKKEPGVNRFETAFKVDLYAGRLCYEKFPYKLDQLRGSVLFKLGSSDPSRPARAGSAEPAAATSTKVEIRNWEAVHDGGRLWLAGETRAIPGTPDHVLTLNIQGESCPLDEEWKAGFERMKLDRVYEQLGVRGELTFAAELEMIDRSESLERGTTTTDNRAAGTVVQAEAYFPTEATFDPKRDLIIRFNFRGPSLTPKQFPYDFNAVAGYLTYKKGVVRLQDFQATHGTSQFKLANAELRVSPATGLRVELTDFTVNPLVLDQHVKRALPENLRPMLDRWNVRGPTEVLLKSVIVQVPPARGGAPPASSSSGVMQTNAVGERWRAASATRTREPQPGAILPYSAERKRPPNFPLRLTVGKLWPASQRSQSFAPPTDTKDDSDLTSTLEMANAAIYWNGVLKLNGTGVDVGTTLDDLVGGISCEGRLDGAMLDSMIGNVWLDSAALAQQPIRNFQAAYRVKPQAPDPAKPGAALPLVAELRDLSGSIFGGSIGGEARIVLAEQPRYRVWLTAAKVSLEELARHNKLGSGELKGDAQGSVLLENPPDPRTGKLALRGKGQVDVPQGRLYNLPVLLELVKVIKGQTPDGVAFEEAHVSFELKGDRVNVTQLDLLGTAVSLGGSGTSDLAGKEPKFEFYTIWSQTLRRMLMTPIGEVTGAMSGGLFKIELTRVDGTLTPKAYVLPAITDPLRALADRWKQRTTGSVAPATTVRGAPR